MSERNQLADIVKGIGIILVVLGHSQIQYGHYLIYMFHMPLFFFVSGTLHKDRGVRETVVAKGRKMWKPYVVFFILCSIVDIVLYGSDKLGEINPFSPRNTAGPLWFMLSLFEANVCFALILAFARKHFLPVCLILTLSGYILHRVDVHLCCFVDSTMSVMLFYGIGYWLSVKGHKRMLNIPVYVSLLVFVLMYVVDWKLLGLNVNDVYNNNTLMDNFILYVLSALAGITLIYSVARVLSRLNRVGGGISMLGRKSLYVFALHYPILYTCYDIWPVDKDWQRAIFVMVAIILSFCLGSFLHKLKLV